MCLDWVLVHGISLSVAQLFAIAIENILREVCGQSNKADQEQARLVVDRIIIQNNAPALPFRNL